MAPSVTPFLMFQGGQAEAAMSLYVSLFPGARVESITRYGPGEQGPEGTVHEAVFSIAGQRIRCIDSPIAHAFNFTPASSLFVTCDSADEVDDLFEKLSNGGTVLMPLDDYPFSPRYGWVSDRFGVSWQISVSPD